MLAQLHSEKWVLAVSEWAYCVGNAGVPVPRAFFLALRPLPAAPAS